MAKNKFLFILAAASLLSLAACGNTNNSAPVASSSSSSSSQKPTSEGLVFELNDDKKSYSVSHYNSDRANVFIPETYEGLPVTSIGQFAFGHCTALTEIKLPASLTYIGQVAFYECTGLTGIALPASLAIIDSSAFFNCTSLASIKLPSSLTNIRNDAFAGCTGLTSIELPASLTSIGLCAFYHTKIASFAVDAANKNFETDGKALFDKGKATLLYYAPGLTDASYAIPPSVTRIEEDAFCGCTCLTSIAFPSSLAIIGISAFDGCTSLASITLPVSLTGIGTSAFNGCTSLNTINYAGTKMQWSEVFLGNHWNEGCTLLTAVTCTDGSVTL